MDRKIILIAHNLRSCHNVGSLLRTAEGLGVNKVFLTGYTPYPISENDERLRYIANKIHNKIKKTSLGTEKIIQWEHRDNIVRVINRLRDEDFRIIALEQNKKSTDLERFKPGYKLALIVGREVEGVESEILELADEIVSIPMLGKKESFNVVQASAMALYELRFHK